MSGSGFKGLVAGASREPRVLPDLSEAAYDTARFTRDWCAQDATEALAVDDRRAATIALALGLARAPELVAIVGGGGKSSLLFALADSLPGRVVVTTTTRIFAAQMSQAEDVCTLAEEIIGSLSGASLSVG